MIFLGNQNFTVVWVLVKLGFRGKKAMNQSLSALLIKLHVAKMHEQLSLKCCMNQTGNKTTGS